MFVVSLFTPFIGFLITGLFTLFSTNKEDYKGCAKYASLVAIFAMIVSFLFAVLGTVYNGVFTEEFKTEVISLFNWFTVGDFYVNFSLVISPLVVVMVLMVTFVSLCIHIYAVGYMAHDRSLARFMTYLNLFVFFMLILVVANNLVQLFLGWEGVGLVSYLLIGFWYKKNSANVASLKAFVMNRVGDFGFVLGLALIYKYTGTLNITELFSSLDELSNSVIKFAGYDLDLITVITMLLFMGAMAKSAQIGLHTWLPDAMEGPTPISALIHAATMVTAGIFMVSRLSALFELSDFTLNFITLIGAITAIFAATIAVCQYDIKKIIAYSTMSQLGYMFFAVGVSGYGAGIYHLITHAFFKALLFLGAGCIIHSVSGEQDIRKMGGLKKYLPLSFVLMLVGNLALSGIPPFAGYFSKDSILEIAWSSQTNFGHIAYFFR